MKIAYFNPHGDPGEFRTELERHAGVTFAVAESEKDLPGAVSGAEILVTGNRIYTAEPARLIRENADSLRWIAFTTSGFDKAVASGLPAGVCVTNMSGLRSWAIAEHAIFLMLAAMRRTRKLGEAQSRHHWARVEMTPEMDYASFRRMLIVGVGAIGQDIARKAKAFDMHVTGISRSAGPLSHFDVIRPRAELAAAAAEADVVMVSAVAENGSFGLISREVLDSMHSSSILVNIARGSLVDEEALIETLRAGRIAAAAIDVQAQEPVPPEHPLWDLDNLILTPHVAGAGPNTEGVTHASVFAKNLRRWIAGETLDKVVRQT